MSDSEEDEDAGDVFSERDEGMVCDSEGVDHKEDLQRNSATDDKKGSKSSLKKSGERETDASGSEHESQREEEMMSCDGIGEGVPRFSDEEDDEKLRQTEQLNGKDESNNQTEHEQIEDEGCSDKKSSAEISEDEAD